MNATFPSALSLVLEMDAEAIADAVYTNAAAEVRRWSQVAVALGHWEDAELMDGASQSQMDHHRKLVLGLIIVGQFFEFATRSPSFPDRATAEQVTATLSLLRDKLAMWHPAQPMSEARRAEILVGCGLA